eukprot:3752060-Rhodomonas_salina.1
MEAVLPYMEAVLPYRPCCCLWRQSMCRCHPFLPVLTDSPSPLRVQCSLRTPPLSFCLSVLTDPSP